MKSLYTVGHSNRTLKEFFEMLLSFKITHLIDIRTMPRSRHVPWFNFDNLALSCSQHNIKYIHQPTLGGLRKARRESINNGWENASFRGFADYMQTKDFFTGLKELNAHLRRGHHVAIMCAESVPWRCHRSLIADAELIRKIKVFHIMNKKTLQEHKLTSFAEIDTKTRPKKIYYPPHQRRLI